MAPTFINAMLDRRGLAALHEEILRRGVTARGVTRALAAALREAWDAGGAEALGRAQPGADQIEAALDAVEAAAGGASIPRAEVAAHLGCINARSTDARHRWQRHAALFGWWRDDESDRVYVDYLAREIARAEAADALDALVAHQLTAALFSLAHRLWDADSFPGLDDPWSGDEDDLDWRLSSAANALYALGETDRAGGSNAADARALAAAAAALPAAALPAEAPGLARFLRGR